MEPVGHRDVFRSVSRAPSGMFLRIVFVVGLKRITASLFQFLVWHVLVQKLVYLIHVVIFHNVALFVDINIKVRQTGFLFQGGCLRYGIVLFGHQVGMVGVENVEVTPRYFGQ